MNETSQIHSTSSEVLNAFFQDCGGDPAYRLELTNRETAESQFLPLTKPCLLLGRSGECDHKLKHWDISYRHTYLQILGGRLLAVDLGSRSGTRWSNERRRSGWVTPGSAVSVGPFELKLIQDPTDNQSHSEISVNELLSRGGGPLPQASLELLSANSRRKTGRKLVLKPGVTLVGRSRVAQVRLKHESVSHIHTSIVLTKSGLWVVDLLGRGGTLVNGTRIEYARLQHGDELNVGQFFMQVDCETLKSSTQIKKRDPSDIAMGDSQSFDIEENSSSIISTEEFPSPNSTDTRESENESARWSEIIETLKTGGFGT